MPGAMAGVSDMPKPVISSAKTRRSYPATFMNRSNTTPENGLVLKHNNGRCVPTPQERRCIWPVLTSTYDLRIASIRCVANEWPRPQTDTQHDAESDIQKQHPDPQAIHVTETAV